MPQLNAAGVVFTHADNFTGDVEIAKGETTLKVSMEALVLLSSPIRASQVDEPC